MSLWRTILLGGETNDAVIPEVREQSPGTIPPARPSIDTVTVDTALGIGAVYRAVQIIVTTLTQMRLVPVQGQQLHPLAKRPNVNDTRAAFIQETGFSLAGHGEAFWRLTRKSATALPTSARVLDPKTVTVDAVLDRQGLDTGRRTYHHGGRLIEPWRIKHLKLLRRPGQVRGLGPIQAANGELTGALKLRQFADQWFDTSTTPDGTLSTDLVLGPGEAEDYAKAWREFIRKYGLAVLSNGLKYSPNAIDPEKAQFVDVQRASVLSIARLFGLPAYYMLTGIEASSSTYSNQQELGLVYLQTTLQRYMGEIEDAFNSLLPDAKAVAFHEPDLLRMSAKLKAEVEKLQIEAGTRTPDELRGNDGLDPLPTPPPAEGGED